MKLHITAVATALSIACSALAVSASDDSEQTEFPQILAQPTDQSVALGESAELSVGATNADGYQWLRNGVAIEGETNRTLILKNVGTNDVGYYSCTVIKGLESVPTRAAGVTAYSLLGGGFTVFGTPIVGNGSGSGCPGNYIGYVNFTKTIAQGWGWAPSTNTTVHTATDSTRSNTILTYLGKLGDMGCNPTTVTVPHPAPSPKYRFTVYFTNNVPTNAYSIDLEGFDQ